MKHKAIALFSGGLDSSLAILTLLREGLSVRAVKFLTPFETDASRRDASSALSSLGDEFGFEVEIRDLGERFFDLVQDPKHGYGRNLNPCIDCRIFMLREAARILEETGSHCIVTGEVLGQRPMSQRRDMLYHIDKEAGVKDLVLRPLCAKLLRATIVEENGIVQRENLHGFNGRSRKGQMALAKEFGLSSYPSPAGGCLLTEPNYARRLNDLLIHGGSLSMKDVELLRIGRHFRFSSVCRIIVGRNESENLILESDYSNSDCILRAEKYAGPSVLVTGDVSHEALRTAAALCIRYADTHGVAMGDVLVTSASGISMITSARPEEELIDSMRIGNGTGKNTFRA